MPAASRSIPYRPRSGDLTKVSIKPTLPAEWCGRTPDEEGIVRIRARLASLEAERTELEASLAEIERRKAAVEAIKACSIVAANTLTVTTASPTADKVALFRRLFAGRSDVFPLRWENVKTGKAGYAPACANEWIRGVCGKPQVKCGTVPIKPSSPCRTRSSTSICGAAMARAPLSPASIRCCRMKPAGFWPPISTRKAGRPTLRRWLKPAKRNAFPPPSNAPGPAPRPCLDLLFGTGPRPRRPPARRGDHDGDDGEAARNRLRLL